MEPPGSGTASRPPSWVPDVFRRRNTGRIDHPGVSVAIECPCPRPAFRPLKRSGTHVFRGSPVEHSWSGTASRPPSWVPDDFSRRNIGRIDHGGVARVSEPPCSAPAFRPLKRSGTHASRGSLASHAGVEPRWSPFVGARRLRSSERRAHGSRGGLRSPSDANTALAHAEPSAHRRLTATSAFLRERSARCKHAVATVLAPRWPAACVASILRVPEHTRKRCITP